ncbi:MAG: hypothetical protein EB059_04190 [Alphaproteobacteria bacterium]|nr:hypothetical protein [Alphaproteobacteria bacterium]
MKRPQTAIRPEDIYKVVFHPAEMAPVGTSAQYRFMRSLVLSFSYAIVLLIFIAIAIYFTFGSTYFYHVVVLDRERVVERVAFVRPLETPNLTRTGITNMAMNIATEVLTYGFNNADERLLRSRRLFTEDAWIRFAKAHLKEGRLDTIKSNQQVLTNIASNNAVITEEGVTATGVQKWVVQVPIITTYQAGKKISAQKSTLQLTLIKASTLEHAEGVAIDGWDQI